MTPPSDRLFQRSLLLMALATATLLGCQFDTMGLMPYDGGADVAVLPDASEAGVPPDGGGGCANGSQRCYGTFVQLCEAGTWSDHTPCPWGCGYNTSGYPYCGEPLWAENVNPENDVGTASWVADVGLTTINTDTGDILTPNGPLNLDFSVRTHFRGFGLGEVTIMGFTEIQIPVGARVEVVGVRALALVSYGSIVIGGGLFAQGQSNGTAGPGGYAGGTESGDGLGPGGGQDGNRDSVATLRSGAGGGGYAGVGGDGATVSQMLGTQAGGAGGDALSIDPVAGLLEGGSGGGASSGGIGDVSSAPGGGGGGALMLAAQLSVEVLPTGVVNVGGGGGSSHGGGGGGGSGGMVLIQAYSCTIAGVVAANGGGGGDVSDGDAGTPGTSSDQRAPGGGDHGGYGGAGSTVQGSAGTATDFNGGGGGGAAGFIRLDTVLPIDMGQGMVSPPEGTAGHAQNPFPLL